MADKRKKKKKEEEAVPEIAKTLAKEMEERSAFIEKRASEGVRAMPTFMLTFAHKIFKPIPYKSVTLLLRQLVMLVEAGVPLLKAIKTLASRERHKRFKKVISDLASSIEGGSTLWQSFASSPQYFSPLFVSVVKAGETSGTLPEVLRRLADHREKKEIVRKRLLAGLAYPIIVFILLVVVVIFFTIVVIPEFERMYTLHNLELPTIAKTLIVFRVAVLHYWWLWLLALLGLLALYQTFVSTESGRLTADRVKLKLPIFGELLTKVSVADFTRTFSTLLNAGISIVDTLELTKEAVSNKTFSESLENVKDSVLKGEGIEKPLRQSSAIPPIVTDLLVTGEESGALAKISDQIADIYEKDVDVTVSNMMALVEPIMVLIMGIAVAYMALAFFWPYISLITQLSGGGAPY